MAQNKILSIPQWLLVATTSTPESGYSAIFPKAGSTNGLTGSWYTIDEYGNEKRIGYDYYIGAGLSYSEVGNPSPYGYRLDVKIAGGLTYSNGTIPFAPISVWGLTPSMLAITGSYVAGYVLSTSTVSGEFKWIESLTTINGPTNAIPKFTGSGTLTASSITDNGTQVNIGWTGSINTYTFSVSGSRVNFGVYGQDSFLHLGDSVNNYIKGQLDGGITIRTTDEFRVEVYTNSLSDYAVINFDNSSDANNKLQLLNNTFDFSDLTYSKYLSASSLNSVIFGKTSSNFLLELYSATQGAIKINDGGQASYSVLYSDSNGIGKWGQITGYNGLSASGLSIGLDLMNLKGLTYSGGTFGFDYTRFATPLTYSATGTISIATVSVVTGVTYGSVFETPTFRLDEYGRIITIMTVSTSAFTGPQGPTGTSFVWSGSYATSSTYSFYNVVEYLGSSYISTGTNSPGNTPSFGPSWSLMVARGATGATGEPGLSFSWKGTYATSSTYSFYNVVFYEGSSYISLGTVSPGVTPSTSTQSWNLLAQGSNALNVTGTYGAVLVYGESGWTALGPGTAGWVLTSGGTSSLPYWEAPTGSNTMFGTFSKNFLVVLNSGKSFGKYVNGQTIPSFGLTLEDFIYDVVTETLNPDIYLNITDPIPGIPFGSTSSPVSINFGWEVKNPGSVAVSGLFERTTTPPDGPWTFLSDLTASNNNFNDTVNLIEYDTPTFTYRYTIIDSKGGSASISKDLIVVPYEPPTITLTVTSQKALTTTYGEQQLVREYGKVESVIQFGYDRKSERIDLISFKIKSQPITHPNTSPYPNAITIYDQALPDPDTGTVNRDHNLITPVSKETPKNITRMRYTVDLVDEKNLTTTSSPQTVVFEPLYFFGPVGLASWQSKDLTTTTRADLMNANSDLAIQEEKDNFKIKIESSAISSNPAKLTFFTGYNPRMFIVAIPSTKTLTGIVKNSLSNPGSQPYAATYLNDSALATIASYDSGFSTQYRIYRIQFGSGFTSEDPANLYADIYLELTIS